jgi:hypothetical protein
MRCSKFPYEKEWFDMISFICSGKKKLERNSRNKQNGLDFSVDRENFSC